MADLLPSSGSDFKSFWGKKEGKGGIVILAICAAIVFYFLFPHANQVLIYFRDLLDNLTSLALHAAGVAAIIWIITMPAVRTLVSAVFQGFSYHITDIIIGLDPVGIAMGTLKKLGKMIARIHLGRQKLLGKKNSAAQELQKIQDEIAEAQEEYNDYQKQGALAKKKYGDGVDLTKYTTNMAIEDNKVKRLGLYLKKLQPVYQMMDDIYISTGKIETVATTKYQMMSDNTEIEKRQRSFMGDLLGAIRDAKSVIQGGEVKRLYDLSTQRMIDDFNRDMGEVTTFMQDIAPMIDKVDLNNQVQTQKALDKINSFLEEKQDILMIPDADKVFKSVGPAVQQETVPDLAAISGKRDYAEIITKKIKK